jgi:hypothetical protein
LHVKFYANGYLDDHTHRCPTVGKYELDADDFVALSFDKEIAGLKQHREKIV